MKLHLALLSLLPTAIHAACYTPHKPQISSDKHRPQRPHRPQSKPNHHPNPPQKRDSPPQIQPDDPLLDTLPFDPLSGASAVTIELPPQFLPPPWTPFSGLDSPYPSTGVSPWDDSGRDQMIDNGPSIWRQCPRIHLDCRKCPRDARCRRATQAGGGSSGITGVAPENDGNSNCPISKCDVGGVLCGVNAKCTRGYCVCDLGLTGNATGWRGSEGLGQVTVYVDPAVDCSAKCDGLSCKEVQQLDVGVCFKSGDTVDGDDVDEDEPAGPTYGNVVGNVTINGQTIGLGG